MGDDPRNWRLDISQAHIELYLELLSEPRSLTADEARMMVELVDAWRAHEQRKHIALTAVRAATTLNKSQLPEG
jgi:hypothetical protein